MRKMKTTFVRITFGFNLNKLGHSKYYRKGEGDSLVKALEDMQTHRGNSPIPQEQLDAIKNEISEANKKLSSNG